MWKLFKNPKTDKMVKDLVTALVGLTLLGVTQVTSIMSMMLPVIGIVTIQQVIGIALVVMALQSAFGKRSA